MRLEGENDTLAHELVTSKVTLHSRLLEVTQITEKSSTATKYFGFF